MGRLTLRPIWRVLMASPVVVLIHGFSGLPTDLDPLSQALAPIIGEESILQVVLPGHCSGSPPPVFEEDLFVVEVSKQLRTVADLNRPMVVVGHSTGGNIALAALEQSGIQPAMLVLAATPFRIDLSYLDRWQHHRADREPIPFFSVAGLISLINATGVKAGKRSGAAMIIQGEQDELVPVAEGALWQQRFIEPIRMVVAAGGAHHLFSGANGKDAVAAVVGAIAAFEGEGVEADPAGDFYGQLVAVEPECQPFFEQTPVALANLQRSPSGRKVNGVPVQTPEWVDWQPVHANIEITTRCNLACRFCARNFTAHGKKDMDMESFAKVLDLLPHAYRVNLVGLGEPLLHPRLFDFVAYAKGRGRRVSLVSNGMLLKDETARQLIKAGIDAVTFSVDAAEQTLADQLRAGIDLDRVVANIRNFTSLAGQEERLISTAVFTAVSMQSVGKLTELVELISTLGVHVMMMSDLNFDSNRSDCLAANLDAGVEKLVREGITKAFGLQLPVLTVRGLEELGLAKRYHDSLLVPPHQLYRRSLRHEYCYSPWQTVPVNVDGNITLCDCQPDKVLGNLFDDPFEEIWNGLAIRAHRRSMLSDQPPKACRGCPRF